MLRLILALFLLIPMPVLADHVPTQEPYGYEQSINAETGDLTIRLLGSDGFEDSPPEKYTIFFGMATGIDENSFCISTSFGHVQNQWSDQVFSIANLRTYFELPVGTFYYRVRSDNDTDNSYSTISIERSIALPDQVPFNETQTDWSAPTSTCVDTSTTTTTTSSTTTSSTTTTVPDTTTTTSSTTTTTTTIPEPPPPPPEPEEPYVDPYVKEDKEVVMDDGSVGTYSQADIDDGTVERDNERQTNEELYGCYITNVALERGDCDIPEEIIEEVIIIIIDDEEYEDEIYEEEYDTQGEFYDDDDMVLEMDDDYEDEEFIELTEEEVLELEKQMELEVELLEREEEFEIYEFETKEEAEEFPEAILEVEEYLEELENFSHLK